MYKQPLNIIKGLVLVVIVGFLWTWVSSPLIVTVTGTGRVSVPATSAAFSVTVVGSSNTASSALAQLKGKVNTIRGLLVTEGVVLEDISESQVGIMPVSGGGYQAVEGLGVKTSDVGGVGDLIVKLYNNGAAVVSQPIVAVENQDELEKQAIDEAFKEAAKEVNVLAMRKLKPIRKVISISQVSSGNVSSSTKQVEVDAEGGEWTQANGAFEVVRGVSVTYKMW